MKRTIRNPFRIALAAGVIAGLGASLGFIHQSRAELVYDPQVSQDAPVQVRQDDREATRQALEASVKAQDTLQATQPQMAQQQQPMQQSLPAQQYAAPAQQPVQMVQAPAQARVQYVTAQPVQQYAPAQQSLPAQQYAPVQQMQAAPQYQPAQQLQPLPAAPAAMEPTQSVSAASNVADDQQPQVESLSKAELMRRERMRTELENEDLLDERLEELRLRDEKRRTAELLGENPSAQNQDNVAPIQGLALTQPQSQVVVSPVTDHPGEPAPQVAPLPNPAAAAPMAAQPGMAPSPYTQAAQDQIIMAQAAPVSSVNASALAAQDENKSSGFYISPRAGISSMSLNSSLSGVTANGLYSLGIALGVNTSDNLAFEVGYTNAQYGVNIGSMYMVPGLTPYNYQASQNVIDAMLKLYFLGPDSKIRPFIGAGGGYEMLSVNYPSQLTSYLGNNAPSANSNAFLGELAAGLDIKVTKAVSVGAMFKYSDVLSANQSSMYYYGGYGYPGYMGAGVVGPNAQQQLTSASLSAANFYSVLGTVNFAF